MYQNAQKIRHFLFSQYLADGIRITLEIVLPVIICAWFGKFETGITISLGALCVSISDAPGPIKHKSNGMLYCNIFIFVMALLTGMVNGNIVLLGLLIATSTFFFSMFSVYGSRAASIGTAALLVMILRMAHVSTSFNSAVDSLLILGGGVWYMLVALLFYRLTPYRPAQRSLGECIHETAKYLRIKSDLYDSKNDIGDEYTKLVTQQVRVNEKQEEVRELLFKNRQLLKESIRSGRLLVITFADLVDLYENITATWYDYDSLRKQFSSSGILDEISVIIKNIADELDNVGLAIQADSSYTKEYDVLSALNDLKKKIEAGADVNKNAFVLKKILVNLRDIGKRVNALSNYFGGTGKNRRTRNSADYSKFVSHQKIEGTVFINNLTLKSSAFRHSLRMMITCLAGYIIAKLLPNGHHSYWLLLTIIVILKPGFSLTKQRNFQRFTGTMAGGLIGLLILYFVHDRTILYVLIVFFMIGSYTFQRWNYIVMVTFLTPFVLILFSLLGLPFMSVAAERLLDTAIGSLLALVASYLLFPHWESNQLNNYMSSVLQANINYLDKLREFTGQKSSSTLNYKLARKEVFLSAANLSGAFNRMLSEPKSKQRNKNEIFEFVVLNNVLSSNIAGLISGVAVRENVPDHELILSYIGRSIFNLEKSISKFDGNYLDLARSPRNKTAFIKTENKEKNQLLQQFEFVYKLTNKINKISAAITTE